MTFSEIKTAIKDQCNLTSTDADTRIGKSVNRYYRRVTSSLGLDATRQVTRSQTTTNGVQTVTFTSIESIDFVVDTTDSNAIRALEKCSFEEVKTTQPGTGQATKWAIQSVTATTVTIILDTLPQTTYTLQASGTATLSDLTSSDVPVIAESYHDILTFAVIAEELRKKEKINLAESFRADAERLLAEYRFELAEQATADALRQRSRPSAGAGGTGGSAASVGGTAYTQTAILTFNQNTLRLKDTDGTHGLTVNCSSNLTAERTLSIASGDADRTVTLSGNPTLSDWFDQSVKAAASPTFAGVTISGTGASALDVGGGINAGTGNVALVGADGKITKLSSTEIGATTSAQLAGVISDETGSGVLVFATDPNLGRTFINDTSNANVTTGLTINQGGADDNILDLKSSDVAHGITDAEETDTYAAFAKASATAGGVRIRGLAETGTTIALQVQGMVTDETGTRDTATAAPVTFDAAIKSGTSPFPLSADRNLLCIRNNGTARFFFDSDGDSHQDVGTAWTNFDTEDDIALMDSMAVALAREGDPLREDFVKHFEQHRELIESVPGKKLVSFNDDGHHFVNMSRLAMVHHGAIRQLAAENKNLQKRLEAAEKKLLAHRR